MGATDSAQVTDLVGLYLIHELALGFPELQGGAYRDDALFIVNLPPLVRVSAMVLNKDKT